MVRLSNTMIRPINDDTFLFDDKTMKNRVKFKNPIIFLKEFYVRYELESFNCFIYTSKGQRWNLSLARLCEQAQKRRQELVKYKIFAAVKTRQNSSKNLDMFICIFFKSHLNLSLM